jgi:DNA-binding HxlR family transcriptional regulator
MTLLSTMYQKDCPTRKVLDLIGNKWAVLIIGLLEHEPKRFSELQRGIVGISHKMLTQTLRGLERDGLITRTVYPQVPPCVEYRLTSLGKTLCAPLATLRDWAEENIEAITQAQQGYDLQVIEASRANRSNG